MLQVITLATWLQVLHLRMESHVCALKIAGPFRNEKDLLQDLNTTWESWKLQHKENHQQSLRPEETEWEIILFGYQQGKARCWSE